MLIVSTQRFQRFASRAIVAPQIELPPDEVAPPWRIEFDGAIFAVDMLRSISVDRLLERVDRCPAATVAQARRVLAHIN